MIKVVVENYLKSFYLWLLEKYLGMKQINVTVEICLLKKKICPKISVLNERRQLLKKGICPKTPVLNERRRLT